MIETAARANRHVRAIRERGEPPPDTRVARYTMHFAFLLACQEPFGADRHDLAGFRIAALTAARTEQEVVPSVALIVDGEPWSDQPVDLRWFAMNSLDPTDLAGLPADSLPDAIGPRPAISTSAPALGLIAIAPDGREQRAWLELVDAQPVRIESLDLYSIGLTLDTVAAGDLTVDSRAQLAATPAAFVTSGGFGRLQATVDDDPPMMRWMATGGTFFELDRVTADWAAGEIELDDDEIVGETALSPGPQTLIAIAVSDVRANAFQAREVWVDAPAPGVWTSTQRWIGADQPVDQPTWATLVPDDSAPTGVRLVDLEPAAAAPLADPWGTRALPCSVSVEGPFDPNWLLEGVCTRTQVAGGRVLVGTP